MANETQTITVRPEFLKVLHRLQPVCALSPVRLRELAGFCVVEEVSRGQNPFRLRGIEGQSVYLLAGEMKLGFADGSSSIQVGGSEAACWPLAKRPPVLREAKAITDITLLRIDDEMLDIMMTWDQLAAASATPDNPVTSATLATLATVPEPTDWSQMSGAFRLQSLTDGALSRLPSASIDALFRRFERIRVNAGDVILREGEAGDYYYIIESGRCAVTRKVGGVEMPLAALKAGDAFGEEALVAESTRNATVSMTSSGVLLRLGKQDFIELLREPLLKRLSWEAAERQVAAGAIWLDVRYPSEYQEDRLPGAINVPLNEIRHAIGVLDRDCQYVVYCQSGRRSSAAAFLLSQHGYHAYWLENGLSARAS